tara:strand:+ start:154 stop:618 length:465 start_codon:yes stop_codon:yes gene_type:complete
MSNDAASTPTGCGMSVRFGGATMPCGFLLSYGTTERTLANTYVLTGKTKYSLRSEAELAACTAAHPPPNEVMSVKTALHANMETPIYRDVYRYSVGIQNDDFDVSAEMERMGVVDWSARMVGGGLDTAYEAVHHSCRAAFGIDHYALYAFRVSG